jgi:hypothetical protein
MTVDERYLVRHNHPGDTYASPFGSSDESESSNEGIKMKPWQNNAVCANSDSETEMEIDDAPKFCKGQWVWYRQDDAVPVQGQVTRDSLEKQDVHIILYNSGAKRVCRQKFVVAATPPPEFVQSDTKQEAASDIAHKKSLQYHRLEVSENLLGRQSLLSSHYKLLTKAGIPHPTIVQMNTMAKDFPINR